MSFFQQKNVSFGFLSRSKSLLPFFLLSFAGLSPTSSFSLSFFFSCSTIYLSLILSRQHGYRNNFHFPFSSLLTLLLSLLYKTPVAMRFPAKITLSCIWVAIPDDWVILHWYACGVDGRYLGWAIGVRHVVTKYSRMGRLLHFLTHGALLARFACKSSAKNSWLMFKGRDFILIESQYNVVFY